MVIKNLEYYLRLPYTTNIKRGEGDEYWVARVVELPHCMTHGYTTEEALKDLDDAKREWLESNLERNLPIPEPTTYKGQFHLRMPPSLHERLALMADVEGVSLNQYMISKLAANTIVTIAEGKDKAKPKKEKKTNQHTAVSP